jgi:polyphosphate kinase
MELVSQSGFNHLRYDDWVPSRPAGIPQDVVLWDLLKQKDLMLFHPYESFLPVINLIKEASVDPGVLAIKMTLYRTSGDSPIIRALEKAAEKGKQVTVLVELKARFDEERNIEWAQRLEQAGVIVVYGIARLKVHAKALLIVRREEEGIQRYVHLGTGNYNDKTAKLYTDIGFLSSKEALTYETSLFFNAITGYSTIPSLTKLIMAPSMLKQRLLQLIERETQRSSTENPGRIIVKLNALADPDIIRALYRASREGVEIKLNIRGICMLVPGIEGMSDNITVISIVDRFLEHARLMCFRNGGLEEVYCSSADWMPRNLDRRVELMFPVDDEPLKKRAIHILNTYFEDNCKAHTLNPDGSYTKKHPRKGRALFRSQEALYREIHDKPNNRSAADTKEFVVRRKPPRSTS